MRREAYFEATIEAKSQNAYSELMRIERGIEPDESKIAYDLERMQERLDTSDFKLPAILWMLY